MPYGHWFSMETTDTAVRFQRWSKRAVIFLGIAATLLGCLVLVGWHARMPSFVQVLPSMVPMQYNTALGFTLGGLGVVLLIFNRSFLAIPCLGLAAVLGLATLAQYLSGLDFGLDQLFMEHYIQVKTSHPGRMAPNTALCFLLASVALILRSPYCGKTEWCRLIAGILGAVVLMLGALALVGYIVGAETGYGWGRFTRMAVHTAVGFMLLGGAILVLVWFPSLTVKDTVQTEDSHGAHKTTSATNDRRRIIAVSILIMCAVSLAVGTTLVRELYHAALEQERISLKHTLNSWVELINVVAEHNEQEYPNDAEATLNEVAEAYEKFGGFRETGEIVLVKQEGDEIEFLPKLRRERESRAMSVQVSHDWDALMRKALSGDSGMLLGKDYRGEEVLAAYRYIESLDMGLLIKVDLDETKYPFYRAALLAISVAFVVIMLGSLAFIFKVNSIIRQVSATRELKRTIYNMGRILDNSWNEIYAFDANTFQFVGVSKGARNNLGYSMEELRQLTPVDLMPEFTSDQFNALIDPLRHDKQHHVTFEANQQRKDNTKYPVEVRVYLGAEETPPVFAAIIQDISERKLYIEELERKALYDALTNLPNRSLLQERLQFVLKVVQREAKPLAVFVINLARLREINDLMGHQSGDLVLKEVADRLKQQLRGSDTVARLGGDEYGIILPSVGISQVHVVVEKIKIAFDSPVIIGETPLEIEAAIGVALYPDHGDTPTTLLQHADIAMHFAKYETSAYSIYNPEDDPFSLQRLRRHGELRRALDEKALTLYYQPKIDLKTGKVKSVEALARWVHPTEGMISPGEFIPMIEQSGMIRPFTFWVLEQAIEQCKCWAESDLDLSVSVNLSTRNLLDPTLPDHILGVLEAHEVSPDKLSLEITETSMMARPERALKLLARLHEIGFTLSIDDFGTGYSSLAYLKKLPVNELKIDQSFVFGMEENENDVFIVRSTIDLAHNLGLVVVAEGIENEETLEMLGMMRCDIGQGYHFSRPLPVDELAGWLSESPWGITGATHQHSISQQ